MKKIFILLMGFILASCASQSKKDGLIDLSEITNEDFQQERPLPYNRAQDFYHSQGDKYSKALNDETMQLLEDVSDTEKTDSDDLAKISRACYQKEFNDAFQLADSTYNRYRNNPIYWNTLGICFYLKKENRKALLYYNKALEFNAKYVPSLNNIGVMYVAMNEDQKALVAFERARAAGDFSKTPRFNIGQLYLKYGLGKKALATFSALQRLSSDDVDVLNGLASAQLMNGDFRASVNTFKQIDDSFLEEKYIGLNYAVALFYNGQKDEAVDAFEDVNRKNLGVWGYYYQRVSQLLGVK